MLNSRPLHNPQMSTINFSEAETSRLGTVSETPKPRAVQKELDHRLHSFPATTTKGEMVDEN